MNKKFLTLFCLLFLCSAIAAESITGFTVPASARLNEKISVAGQYNADVNAYVLCKFVISDSNNDKIDRWSDEYTFSDGTFYAEKVLIEPPYYRGDSFNVKATCGVSSEDANFLVSQPTSIAHPIQMGWEYAFSENNLDALMLGGSFIAIVIIVIFVLVFFAKKGKQYAGG